MINEEESPVQKVEYKPSDDSLDLSIPVQTHIEIEVDDSKDSIANKKAKRFVELVKSGVTPGEAASTIGTRLKNINTSDDMKVALTELLTTAKLDGKIREQMVKAGLNKLFLKTVDSNDVKDMKIALETAKLIGADEGIKGPVESGVTIDVGSLWPIIKDVTLPGITIEIPKETDAKEN